MIGSQYISDRNRAWVQVAALIAMFAVRFSYDVVGQFIYVITTYALSYVFFLTIPAEARSLYNLCRPNRKTVVVAASVALLTAVLNIAVWHFWFGLAFEEIGNIAVFMLISPFVLITMITTQFFLNALPEEFLFRGFFWGYSRKFKISEVSILCIQTILFWGAHYYYFSMPGPWIMVLLMGLIFGAVAWKTKSLLLSALVHACVNSTSLFFVFPHTGIWFGK